MPNDQIWPKIYNVMCMFEARFCRSQALAEAERTGRKTALASKILDEFQAANPSSKKCGFDQISDEAWAQAMEWRQKRIAELEAGQAAASGRRDVDQEGVESYEDLRRSSSAGSFLGK